MKKSKEKFRDWRESVPSHADKKIIQLAKDQGRDKHEIDELNGIKHYWK